MSGSADDFDGYPDFLWLEAGKYAIEFRHPSYESVKHEVDVRPGQALRFRDDLNLETGKKRLEAAGARGKEVQDEESSRRIRRASARPGRRRQKAPAPGFH